MKRLLNSKEIAEYLNLDPITIRRKAAKGKIPASKVGNRFRFDKDVIDRWLLRNKAGKQIHILVVDDEPIIGQLFRDSLQESTYQVTTASSSLEALSLIDKIHFDLIFIDLVLPEIDGSELFRRIKEIDKDIPVAIISAYPDSALMDKAMEHGPFLVMKKPFSSNDILAAVRSFSRSTTTRE